MQREREGLPASGGEGLYIVWMYGLYYKCIRIEVLETYQNS